LKATWFAFQPRRKGLLVSASIAYALVVFGCFIGFAALLSGLLGNVGGLLPQKIALDFNPSEIGLVLLGELALAFAIALATASYEAACLRWMIRGERGGLFGLSLDGDTWRVYAGYWLWFLFSLIGGFLVGLLTSLLVWLSQMIGEPFEAFPDWS